MSAMNMRNLENQLALLSFAEQLSLIEYLAKLVRQHSNATEQEPTPQLQDAMFEALQISDDPTVKTFSSTKELFEDLNA